MDDFKLDSSSAGERRCFDLPWSSSSSALSSRGLMKFSQQI
ncbi:hypothetical protein KR52_10435 [Synechococcus sp. KORDI-52]|nr:hypothetical protein KR52_10435 [Synechococcus sp. KORDI-52]